MTANKLTTFPNDTFMNMPNVEVLELRSNLFEILPVLNICRLKNLETLTLRDNRIQSAYFDDCFTQLHNLYRWDLSENPINEIKQDDFEGLRNSSISELNLQELNITTLTKECFRYLPYLQVLDLTNNKLVSIKSDIFYYVSHISFLILTDTKLNRNPGYMLSNMTYLNVLSIANNNISNSTFGEEFQSLTHLKTLDVSKNPLRILRNISFLNLQYLENLKELDLSSCKLERIEADTFIPLKALTRLKLTGNTFLRFTICKGPFVSLHQQQQHSTIS